MRLLAALEKTVNRQAGDCALVVVDRSTHVFHCSLNWSEHLLKLLDSAISQVRINLQEFARQRRSIGKAVGETPVRYRFLAVFVEVPDDVLDLGADESFETLSLDVVK